MCVVSRQQGSCAALRGMETNQLRLSPYLRRLQQHIYHHVQLFVVSVRHIDLDRDLFAEVCRSRVYNRNLVMMTAISYPHTRVIFPAYGHKSRRIDGGQPSGGGEGSEGGRWNHRNFDPPATLSDSGNELRNLEEAVRHERNKQKTSPNSPECSLEGSRRQSRPVRSSFRRPTEATPRLPSFRPKQETQRVRPNRLFVLQRWPNPYRLVHAVPQPAERPH